MNKRIYASRILNLVLAGLVGLPSLPTYLRHLHPLELQ